MTPTISYDSCISTIPTSFATVSIGSPTTPLFEKLAALSSAGFQGIELGFPDLVTYASQASDRDIAEDDYSQLSAAAESISSKCQELGLRIMMLQPFANFEGWPKGSRERDDAFKRANGWIEIMQAADCDLLQVGSSDSEGISQDREDMVGDLRELADLLAEKGFRLAYENWCWSTHAPNWADVWDIVKKVDRGNIGLCLDTFQSAGGEWGDPTTQTGRVEDVSEEELEKRYKKSLNDLVKTVPKEKIYLLQISDAYKPSEALSKQKDDDGLRPRGRWSHDFRPLPFNGGYLPILHFARAVLQTGFRDWFSMEVFDGMDGKAEATGDLKKYAERAMNSHKRLLKEATT